MAEDRTSEFFQIANALSQNPSPFTNPNLGVQQHNIQKFNPNGTNLSNNNFSQNQQANDYNDPENATGVPRMSTLKREAYAELRNFHVAAADISRDISSTSTMLSELTDLVRRKGLFMDDTDRVNVLVIQIKQNIENLNGRLEDAQVVINKQKRRLGSNSQAGQEASNLVGQLKEEFVKATSGFKSILQQRTDALKEQSDRKKMVFGSNLKENDSDKNSLGLLALGSKPPVYNRGLSTGSNNSNALPMLDLTSALLKEEMSAGESTSSGSQLPRPRGVEDFSGGGLRLRHNQSFNEQQHVMTPLEIQQSEFSNSQEQQQHQLIPDHNYLRERADAMTAVESHIVELGTIFNRLAVMVSEQQELVQRVEDNVNDANDNINLGMMTLTETLRNLQTNKMLAMKVLGVILGFIILFVTFFA